MFEETVQKYYGQKKNVLPRSVGIEVEAENSNSNWNFPVFESWSVKDDGSLVRGVELVSKPFVLHGFSSSEIENTSLFKELEGFFKVNKVIISERASTHVHYNVKNLPIMEVLNLVVGYYLIENMLIQLTSEDRRANHFCLALSDSLRLIDKLVSSIKAGRTVLPDQEYKYSSLNLGRARDLGTVEVRIMGALTTAEDVVSWAKLVSDTLSSFEGLYLNPSHLIEVYLKNKVAFIKRHSPYNLLTSMGFTSSDMEDLCDRNLPILLPMTFVDWSKSSSNLKKDPSIPTSTRNVEFGEDFEEELPANNVVQDEEG